METLLLENIPRSLCSSLNVMFSHCGRLAFTALSENYVIAMSPAVERFTPALQVDVRVGEHLFQLQVAGFPYSGELESVLQNENLATLPEELRLAIFGAYCDDLLNRIEEGTGERADITISTLDPGSQTVAHTAGFELFRAADGRRVAGGMAASEDAFHWLSRQFSTKPARLNQLDENTIIFEVRLEVGTATLPFSMVGDLAKNDIVFIDATRVEGGRGVELKIGSKRLALGIYQSDTVKISSLGRSEMAEFDEKGIASDDQDGAQETNSIAEDLVESLPVKLSFDLGGSHMSLNEIRKLQPGYVFELQQGIEKPVSIRANGKLCGAGQLVQVGDRLGIRIMELLDNVA